MKDKNQGRVQDLDAQATEAVRRECNAMRLSTVRRPSGYCIVLGLFGGVLLIQAAFLGYSHWADAHNVPDDESRALWQVLLESQRSAAAPKPAQSPAFYPPPGWDRGLFSSKSADDSTNTAHGSTPYSLEGMLDFLRQLHGEEGGIGPRQTSKAQQDAFQQASTAKP